MHTITPKLFMRPHLGAVRHMLVQGDYQYQYDIGGMSCVVLTSSVYMLRKMYGLVVMLSLLVTPLP